MAMGSYYAPGDHNAVCDVCGWEFKRSQMLKRWDGALCCRQDWEPRHPLDSIKARTERQDVKDARPEPVDYFVGINEVTPESL